MTLPPNTEHPQNSDDDNEFVVPEAALPEESEPSNGDDATMADPGVPSADPLAPSPPPAAVAQEPSAYVPPVYNAPIHTPAGQSAGTDQPVSHAAPPAPPVPPMGDGQPQNAGHSTPPPQKTNTLAILSLVSAFIVSILGIILGHIALGQIKRTGEGGRGLALAGTILGYVFSFAWIAAIIAIVAGAAFVASNVDSIEAEIQQQLEEMEESGELPEGFLEGQPGTGEPQVDAELEPFCTAYDVYFDEGGELEYLQSLADTAPDAQLQEVWQSLADEWAATANESEEQFDAFMNRYLEADEQAWELCY